MSYSPLWISHRHRLSLLTLIACLTLGMRLRAEEARDVIPFKSPHRAMIVVDVRINGLGPFDFLLDTGASSTSVDADLIQALHLPVASKTLLATSTDFTDVRRVQVNDINLGAIHTGPLLVLAQPLSTLKRVDAKLHGILGQDVLSQQNLLIDNQHHRIQFDPNGDLLCTLTGERVSTSIVRTRDGSAVTIVISVPVHIGNNTRPLHLLLDTGADAVVLQPQSADALFIPTSPRWIADENGDVSPASYVHLKLSVGSAVFETEAAIANTGLNRFEVDGLLSTGAFRRLYIGNSGFFVIFEPKQRPGKSICQGTADPNRISPKDPSALAP